jgi:predicted O-linked N-acetylglucosamine transferase (SPINDLY family)
MGASLLTAVGMPDFATRDLGSYEALALALANNPAHLAAIKKRLIKGRTSFPLFDTVRYTRNLEAAYRHMWLRSNDGLPPEPFAVEAPGRASAG